MRKSIYVINGSGGVGKDTFVDFIKEYVPTYTYSSVASVKNIAMLFGWKGDKTEKDRKMLSDLKDLLTDYNDYPMNCVKSQVEFFRNGDGRVMFIFIREPKEIEKAVKEFKAKTILITNSRVKQITSNHADLGVFNYSYDIIIDNDGSLEDLNNKAHQFCIDQNLI